MNVLAKSLVCALVCGALGALLPGAAFARDPGVNQPGRSGNVGRDPGVNQPGAAGNRRRVRP